MFAEALYGNAEAALDLLGRSAVLGDAYLAGGTGLALQIGHRVSIDLDFFTAAPFKPDEIVEKLKHIGQFQADEKSERTILGFFDRIKFSLFLYRYPVIGEFRKFKNVKIASTEDIAAMKLAAIASRGIKRDFVDLYFICAAGIGLKEAFLFYERKFGSLAGGVRHIKKSLVYFDDAENNEMPMMLKKVAWDEVKGFFAREVSRLG